MTRPLIPGDTAERWSIAAATVGQWDGMRRDRTGDRIGVRTEQETGQDSMGDSEVGQDRTGLDRTGLDWTGLDRTGQETEQETGQETGQHGRL